METTVASYRVEIPPDVVRVAPYHPKYLEADALLVRVCRRLFIPAAE